MKRHWSYISFNVKRLFSNFDGVIKLQSFVAIKLEKKNPSGCFKSLNNYQIELLLLNIFAAISMAFNIERVKETKIYMLSNYRQFIYVHL